MTMLRVKVSKEEYNEATGGPDYSSVAPITCPTCSQESHPWLAHTHTDGKVELQDILYHSSLFKNRDGHYVFDHAPDGTVNPAHWHLAEVLGTKTLVRGEKCRGGKFCPQAHRAAMVRMGTSDVMGRQWEQDSRGDLSEAWNPFNE